MSDHTVAECGYQERDDCADLRARIEALLEPCGCGFGGSCGCLYDGIRAALKATPYQERDDCAEAVRAALTEGQVGELFYAHDPDELRAKANEFLAEAVAAARAEGDEAVRIWHSQYSRVRAECDALRARIEALARGWDYRSCPCGLELDAALAGDDK